MIVPRLWNGMRTMVIQDYIRREIFNWSEREKEKLKER